MITWNRNRLTEKLGINYPIIQGPLGGLSSQRLTVAVSNFGGLGSFGAHSLAPEEIKDVIAEIRSLTAKPFAMNLWVSMEDEGARTSDEEAFNRSLAPLASHLAALGAPRPAYKPYSPKRFEDQVRVLLDANVRLSASSMEFLPKRSSMSAVIAISQSSVRQRLWMRRLRLKRRVWMSS
jgi:nitronate monooxygenase